MADTTAEAGVRAGILLVNLGTPDAPTPAALRRYLAEFLWDRRVVEAPRPIWWLALHGVILRTRPRRSAETYKRVWTEAGSPLLDISRRQARALQQALRQRTDQPVPVALGMRYGNPTLNSALAELEQAGANRILVLPMYPQYSATTTASSFDAIAALMQRRRVIPELRFVRDYHDEPQYIEALAASIQQHWRHRGRAEKLLLSFHGIPQAYVDKGDPYQRQCETTARLLAQRLELGPDEWQLVFQSRFGPRRWLTPYTDKTLVALAGEGVRKVDLACPGFPADCLETLEENAMVNRDLFLEAGGEHFRYIPSLNDGAGHIDMLTELALKHLSGWL